MTKVNYYRVDDIPNDPVPNSIYYVKRGEIVTTYVSSSAGVLHAVSPPVHEHTQSSPATTWTINHNLGYRPVVTLYTVGGVEFEGDVTHISTNQVVVNLAVATAGKARCV